MGQFSGCHCAVASDPFCHPAQIKQAKRIQKVDTAVAARASWFVYLAFADADSAGAAFCLLNIIINRVISQRTVVFNIDPSRRGCKDPVSENYVANLDR